MTPLPFYSDCVGWPRDQLPALSLLVDEGHGVGRGWFLRHVDLPEGEPLRDLIDPRYWGHHFYRLDGWPVFWFTHSCIEYVFAEPGTIARLNLEALRASEAA